MMSVMRRAFKTRLNVNNKTGNMLARWCGISRLAYNICLMKWNMDYRDGVAKHNYYSIKKWFNSVKYERFPFIKECSKWVPEAAIKDLQNGFTNLFQHRGNHPKLHRKGHNDSFRIDGSVVKIDGRTVRLPKKLTIRMMERIPHERRITKINNITVSHKAGLWFISVNYETDMSVCENQATGVVGIDLGVKTLAVCSDGLTVKNPHVLRKRERRKKHLQRIVARRRKGSKNRRKAVARLARYEYHTACKRRDWLHKATRTIADENAVCFMEDLNVNGMLKNHRLAKSISDGSFNEFKRQLSYKTQVRNIDRWYPSSQICSRCGMRKPMPLPERTYECERCGLTLDRDLNAALNILQVGIANYPELMPVEGDNHLNAIGATDVATAPRETGIDHQKLHEQL